LKEVKVITKEYFLCSPQKNEDDFADVRVDETCLWFALQY
jgi:hypothetical protein